MSHRSIASASAVMAAGTVVSRLTGFVRAAIVAATLGLGFTAEIFTVANTIPTSLYILVGGGVLNSVLVPQLVRAMRAGEAAGDDQGEAYAQRLFTAVVVVLLLATVLFVVAAPWLLRLYAARFFGPGLEAQADALVAFARFCLPQVFFYGLYVMLGQMLNARGSFGPMMWAPILNNVVAISIFGSYLVVYGALDPRSGEFTDAQTAWFGLGSTLGITLQALVLIPVLHRTGLRLRLRRDLRGVGLGKAARLGGWTVLFVVVNQVTLVVIVQLLTAAAVANRGQAAGFTVFNAAVLVSQVPHSVITVSLATALLPALSRAAAAADLMSVRDDLVATQRQALAFVLPIAALLVPLSVPVAAVVFGWGAASADFEQVSLTIATMAPGMVFFAVQFLTLRGFYAVEDTRTPFLVQLCVVSPVYITVAVLLATRLPYPPAAVGVAYSAAYLCAAVASSILLTRRLGVRASAGLGAYVLRLLAAALPAAGVAGLLLLTVPRVLGGRGLLDALAGSPLRGLLALLLCGVPAGLVFLALCRLLRITEITELYGRLRRRGAAT